MFRTLGVRCNTVLDVDRVVSSSYEPKLTSQIYVPYFTDKTPLLDTSEVFGGLKTGLFEGMNWQSLGREKHSHGILILTSDESAPG